VSGVAAIGFVFSAKIPKYLETPPENRRKNKDTVELTSLNNSFELDKFENEIY
jgi:hypothetical protein